MIKNKSQAILGYAFLIVIVAAAIISMAVYMKRRIQGSYRKSADVFGQEEQYEPFGGTIEK
jgi:Flp pilus assembly pilin Flp